MVSERLYVLYPPVFEEPPLFVAYKSVHSLEEHHTERWKAYCALRQLAEAEGTNSSAGGQDGSARAALAVFEALGTAPTVPEHVAAGVRHLVEEHKASGAPSQEDLAAFEARVTGVLMRFHGNELSAIAAARR